jgi:uncharacterized protein YecT (DUF1311 family)
MTPIFQIRIKTMKVLFFIILAFISSAGLSQTQKEMNQVSYDSLAKADLELNSVYQKILHEYREDTVFIRRLIKTQKIWIKFRDAQVEMKYPEEPWWYGSMYPMCVAGYLEKLTRDRINTLKEWLQGVEDGEGCGGSIKNF